MRGTRAAKRYAKAILSLAMDNNKSEEVNQDMIDIHKTILGSDHLKNFLASPVLKESEKKSALLDIFNGVGEVTKGSINLLLENGRIAILGVVAKQYTTLYNEHNHIQEATVTTAIPLDAEMEKLIMAKVKELTGGDATLKNVVDESIIGGFVLRVGDIQYDASIARKLSTLERELKDNTYVSKI